jgi:hypothetical protein
MQLRLLDFSRTGECFQVWLFTDPNDIHTGRYCHQHPTMRRAEALDYWRERGFRAERRSAHEYVLVLERGYITPGGSMVCI